MGILDDFIKTIKGQRSKYTAEQRQAEMEKIARENEAKAKAAREKEWAFREKEAKIKAEREREYMGQSKGSDKGYLGEVAERIKEQRREFEEAQKKGAEAAQKPGEKRGPIEEFTHRVKEQRREFEEASKGQKPAPKHAETQTVQEPKPETITAYGRTFTHVPGQPPHVLFDEAGKSVYIDNVGEYLKSGGRIEQRDITAAMDPQMYNIYTSKGGPIGQARYYKFGDVVVSLVPDPFKNYR